MSEPGYYYIGDKRWPAQERLDYEVKVSRIETIRDERTAQLLQAELAAVLKSYGATVSVEQVLVVHLSPEHLLERDAEYERGLTSTHQQTAKDV